MSPRAKENTERINVFFPAEVLSLLREEARKKGITVSGLVRMIVMEYLSRKKE